jgi:hypothetical protein
MIEGMAQQHREAIEEG